MQVISTLCDLCHSEGASTPSETITTITVDTNTIEADLCAKHRGILEDALTPFFQAGRRPTKAAISGTRPVVKRGPLPKNETPCREESCDRVFTTKQGEGMHHVRVHRDDNLLPKKAATKK